MGMSVSLAFFFFCACARQGKKEKPKHFSLFFFAVWTWNRCWAQLTENVEGRPHFSFFLGVSEPGTGASLQKIVKSGSHFSFFAVWWAQLTENVEGRPHFFFGWCLNLEQMLCPAYRKCGEWTALFFFFWRSEPGTGASLQKMWRVDRTFLFFFAVWTWNRCWAELTENVEGRQHFSLFFGVSEPGTGAGLQKKWRERDRDCWLPLIGGNEGLAGFFLAHGKAKKTQALFFFLVCLNLEQVLSRACRKCGRSTALFFLVCLNLEQVLAYRKCGESTAVFFFFRSETRAGAGRVDRNCWERGRVCWLQSTDGNEGLAGLFFICTFSHYYPLFPSFFFCVCLRRARQKRKTEALFFCGLNLEQMLSPAYRKMWKVDRTFFLGSETGTDARPSLTENVEREIGIADFR